MPWEPPRNPARASAIPADRVAGFQYARKPAPRTFGRAVDEPAANCG